MNLNAYCWEQPPAQWAMTPLVTDFAMVIDGSSVVPDLYDDMLAYAISLNSAPIGTYISGGTVKTTMVAYPDEAIYRSAVDPGWLKSAPYENYIDHDLEAARTGFAALIVSAAQARGRPIVFLDELISPHSLPGWATWTNTCAFLSSLKTSLNAQDKLLIANIAVVPFSLTDGEVAQLTTAVDGMTFEMPVHVDARTTPANMTRLISVYRTWLDAGKIVVLICVPPDGVDYDTDNQFLAAFAMMVRRPGDKLFVSRGYERANAAWNNWPLEMGYSWREYRLWSPPTYMERQFKNGAIIADGGSNSGSSVLGRLPRSPTRRRRAMEIRGTHWQGR